MRGGFATFFTMAYIVVLNPLILGFVKDADGQYLGGGPSPNLAAIAAGTALVAGIMTILMGVFANYPLALATGLGLNAFVAFSIASQMTWADAMGVIVLEGLVILVLVLTGFRTAVFHAVPSQLKVAISVGIGLFIALIGLVDAGFVRRTGAGPVPVELGIGGQLTGWPTVVFVLGLGLLITLWVRKVKGAIIISILGDDRRRVRRGGHRQGGPHRHRRRRGRQQHRQPAAAGTSTCRRWPATDRPDQLRHPRRVQPARLVRAGRHRRHPLLVFTLMLADFFDTMGTMTAIGAEAGLLDEEGTPPNAQRILVVDSLAAAAGGAGGVSSNTSYIESASGVGEGARTGLASVVTGVLFLVSILVTPLVRVVPNEAAVPALILVGFLMMQQVQNIDWNDVEIAIPAFLTIILMPFTYSITVGIGAGFVSYVLIKVVLGKSRAVHPMMWVTAGLFAVYFLIAPLTDLVT